MKSAKALKAISRLPIGFHWWNCLNHVQLGRRSFHRERDRVLRRGQSVKERSINLLRINITASRVSWLPIVGPAHRELPPVFARAGVRIRSGYRNWFLENRGLKCFPFGIHAYNPKRVNCSPGALVEVRNSRRLALRRSTTSGRSA